MSIDLGYRKAAVTVNGFGRAKLKVLKDMERLYNISLTIFVVCATGTESQRVREIAEYADLVWSCASGGIREYVGSRALLQVSKRIPVFILTKKGVSIIDCYSDKKISKIMDLKHQYLVSGFPRGRKVKMGNFYAYLTKTILPARSEKEPVCALT